MSTTSSKNFTTLYSGSGSVVPQGAYGNANVVSLLATGTDGANTVGNISATGNVTANYFIGNFTGNISGNILVPGANTEVLFNNSGNLGAAPDLTFNSSSNVLATTGSITATGNIVGGNIRTAGQVSATGNVTGNYILGNGSQLTGLPATYGNANVVTLLAAFGSNTVSTTGNVSAGYFIGNGSQLTGLPASYSNANVASFMAAFGSNTISSTGNITTTANISGGYILGNGSQLTGLPATYGNANVAAFMAAFGSNSVSTTGNVSASYFVGDGSLLTNINAGNIVGAYGNANVANFLANFGSNTISTTGNVNSGNVNTGGLVSATGTITGGNLITGGAVSATGNISSAGNVLGAYLWGDGGNITGVVAGAHTVQFEVKNTSGGTLTRGTPVYVTGTVGATTVLEVSASRADTAATMPAIGLLESTLAVNATGVAIAVGTLSSVDTSTYTIGQQIYVGATGGLSNTRPTDSYVVQSIGSAGRINASTGSIQVNIWNIEDLPNLGLGNIWIGNAGNVATQTVLATYTGNIGAGNISVSGQVLAVGNVTGGNILTGGQVSSAGNITATGNVVVPNAGKYRGDFSSGPTAGRTYFQTTSTGTTAQSLLSVLPGPNHVAVPGTFGTATGLFSTNDVGNASIFGMYSYPTEAQVRSTATGTGNVNDVTFRFGSGLTLGATLTSTGNFSTAGNITAASGKYFVGDGGLLSNIAAANVTGTVGLAQYVTANAQANITSVGTLTSLSVSGNTTSGNLITAGTISATANTANVALSNVVITSQATNSGQQIYPVTPSDISGTNTTINPGRMLFGNGLQGNVSNGVDSNNRQTKTRFGFWDTMQVPANYAGAGENMVNTAQFQLAGNTNSSARLFASINFNIVASEGAGNTFTSTGTVPAAAAGQNSFVTAGNWNNSTAGGMANVGNVILNTATGGVFGTIAATGSTIGNSYGVVGTAQSFNTGIVNNQIYFAAWDSFSGTPSTPGNVFVYYNPGTTNNYGVTHSNLYRQSANYYFLRNDDDVAQTKLGSLRTYHEYQYSTATSGTVNIDKNNAQVQFINPTANVTIGDYQNFVTTANDGTNNDSQTDTVTLVIQQGATPYIVTMPTGNASIKYAGNVTTVGSTANAVTMISISAIRSAANATMYLTTISPEFV